MAAEQGPSILIVDDEPLIRWSVARMLLAAGCRVREAGNAAEAMSLVRDGSPDVVVMDYRLPDTNGFSLIESVRSASPQSAIVLMSADLPDVIPTLRDAGVNAVVAKPFDLDAVTSAVLKLTSRSATS